MHLRWTLPSTERDVKYFTLDLNGKRDTVSADRLKPAFLDADFGLHEGTTVPAPDRLPQTPTLPSSSPSDASPDALGKQRTPLRIVGRSRSGRVIRLPAKLHAVVACASGGSL